MSYAFSFLLQFLNLVLNLKRNMKNKYGVTICEIIHLLLDCLELLVFVLLWRFRDCFFFFVRSLLISLSLMFILPIFHFFVTFGLSLGLKSFGPLVRLVFIWLEILVIRIGIRSVKKVVACGLILFVVLISLFDELPRKSCWTTLSSKKRWKTVHPSVLYQTPKMQIVMMSVEDHQYSDLVREIATPK